MELKKEKLIILFLSINFAFCIRFFYKNKFPFVGISSNPFNESTYITIHSDLMTNILKIITLFFSLNIILYSPYFKILLHPCFLISLAFLSQDIFYITIICFFQILFSKFNTNSKDDKYFGIRYIFPLLALVRHYFITSSPGFGLLWLFESHFYTQFLPIAKQTILLFEFLSIWYLRYLNSPIPSIIIMILFDPVLDFSLLSLLFEILRPLSKLSFFNSCCYVLIIIGAFFQQAAYYSWFTLRIGNPNFVLAGGLIIYICIFPLFWSSIQNSDLKPSLLLNGKRKQI